MAGLLSASGIRHVTGRLVGDESRYDAVRTAPGWKPVYLLEGDVGPLSALAVDSDAGHEDDANYLADPVPGNLEKLRAALADHQIAVDGPSVDGRVPSDAVRLAVVGSVPLSVTVA